MKRETKKEERAGFVSELIKHCLDMKKMRPREVCVFNVIANYGRYQITVGPEYSSDDCTKLNIEVHSRPVEINGYMHHLFVSPQKISALPAHEDIRSNLRGSVIMKDIAIHIVDQDGKGASVRIERLYKDGIEEKRIINLAGEAGNSMIKKYKSSGKLAEAAYKIIQEDILRSMKSHK